jgi:hypothetical protein
MRREQDALGLGYAGLRTNGNCALVTEHQWTDFLDYETLAQKAVRGRRMICLCSYCTEQLRTACIGRSWNATIWRYRARSVLRFSTA